MKVVFCDQCSALTEAARFGEGASGWLTVAREWDDAPDQTWHFCSPEHASTWLANNPLPERTPWKDDED